MTVAQIQQAVRSGKAIAASDVMRWMSDDDLEVLEEVSGLLFDEASKRITPRLEFDVVFGFLVKYFRRAIIESDDRYLAAHEFNLWFKSLWEEQRVPRQHLAELKAVLADLSRHPVDYVRRCVIQGCLEHLFEKPDIAAYFDDWKADPSLEPAWRAAAEWGIPRWPIGDLRSEK